MFSHSTANYLTQVLPFPYVFKLSLSFYISLCSHKSVDYWWCQYVLSPLSLRTQLGNTLNTCNKLDPLSNWERSTWLQQLQCNCTFLFCTICTIWHQVAHCLLVAALSQKKASVLLQPIKLGHAKYFLPPGKTYNHHSLVDQFKASSSSLYQIEPYILLISL